MKSNRGELLGEFIGCFMLILIGAGSVASMLVNGAQYTMWDICMVWGVAITMALYMTASLSGAHLNPAVTLAMAVYRGFPWGKVAPYAIAQMAGTFCAAGVVYALYRQGFLQYEAAHGIVRGSEESQQLASVFSTYPAPYLSFLQAGLVELVITAFLVAVIFCLVDERNPFAPPKALFPIAVGGLVAVIGGAFGSLTGFAMNPARDFGPKLFTALVGWGPVALPGWSGYFWVPLLAPLLGGIIGGGLYDWFVGKYRTAENTGADESERLETAPPSKAMES